jgi:hypothetical protein
MWHEHFCTILPTFRRENCLHLEERILCKGSAVQQTDGLLADDSLTTLKMDAVCVWCSKTSVKFFYTARLYTPEDSHLTLRFFIALRERLLTQSSLKFTLPWKRFRYGEWLTKYVGNTFPFCQAFRLQCDTLVCAVSSVGYSNNANKAFRTLAYSNGAAFCVRRTFREAN